jgi:hypothetical protein
MAPLVPLALAAGGVAAWWKVKNRKPKLTPARKQVYTEALKSLKDPAKLKVLADEFEKEGLHHEASMLRKRAALRAKPEVLKAEHAEAFRKGMASTNPEAVKKLAALAAANKLKQYANGLFTNRP